MKSKNSLWTRDFTIITVGSVVSMLGNALSGFAMSLLVLDYTKSSTLYALYMFLYTLPQVAVPMLSGPFLDRFSRKKVVYMLDFLSAAIYLSMGVLLWRGWFSFPVLAVLTFFVGAINSTYLVAYGSLYPMLITEGNYGKAYSVSSTLETLSVVGIPLSAVIYNTIGIAPLFLFNGISFFLAAVMETRIRVTEAHCSTDRVKTKTALYNLWHDFLEGLQYLWQEKGLLAIVGYFFFSQMAAGAAQVITLPYFKSHFPNGEYYYMLVWGMSMVGRLLGSAVYYRIRIPARAKFAVSLVAYIAASVLEGVYLYFTVAVMVVLTLIVGLCGITSYNIRLAGTQSYVPNEKRGRFNGMFNTLTMAGMLLGQLLSGAATAVLSERIVLAIFMGICTLAAFGCIGMNKKYVAPIYNTDS